MDAGAGLGQYQAVRAGMDLLVHADALELLLSKRAGSGPSGDIGAVIPLVTLMNPSLYHNPLYAVLPVHSSNPQPYDQAKRYIRAVFITVTFCAWFAD